MRLNPSVRHCRVLIRRNPDMEKMILLSRPKKISHRRATFHGFALPQKDRKQAAKRRKTTGEFQFEHE